MPENLKNAKISCRSTPKEKPEEELIKNHCLQDLHKQLEQPQRERKEKERLLLAKKGELRRLDSKVGLILDIYIGCSCLRLNQIMM